MINSVLERGASRVLRVCWHPMQPPARWWILHVTVRAVLALVAACLAETAWAQPTGAAPPQMQFRVHPIVDQQQGGLVLGTITVPQSWKVTSRVEWKYADVSHPVRAMAPAEAPDGSAWVEYFPVEIFS
jgi:hypothetical protein